MKTSAFLFTFLLFVSCHKSVEVLPDSKRQDESVSFEIVGDDISKCMLQNEENLVVFSKTATQFTLSTYDKELKYVDEFSHYILGQNFEAEGMVLVKSDKFLVYGSMNGYPAWGLMDKNNGALIIKSISDRKGVFYGGRQYNFQGFLLVGEIVDGTDKQNLMMEIGSKAEFMDSLSFGSSKNDGAVDILYNARFASNYLLSYTYDGPSGARNIVVYEFDGKLNLKRKISFGGEGYEQPEKMVESRDYLFVCGHTTSFGDPMHDAYLARIDLESFTLDYEKAIKLDGHEGADDMQVTKDGNLAICSFAQMNPYKGGYYALIHPDGNALYQEKFMEYERFYKLQVFDDRVVFLGQKMNADLDVALHTKFF